MPKIFAEADTDDRELALFGAHRSESISVVAFRKVPMGMERASSVARAGRQ